jgi:hypothetical protein
VVTITITAKTTNVLLDGHIFFCSTAVLRFVSPPSKYIAAVIWLLLVALPYHYLAIRLAPHLVE